MKKTQAIRMFDRQKIPYQILEYYYDPENLDVTKIAFDNGKDAGDIYKTLVVKGTKGEVYVAVVPGDKILSLKKLASLTFQKKMVLCPVRELELLTGYIRGGCCPIGMKKPFPVWIDIHAQGRNTILVNAGRRGILIELKPDDLLHISKGKWGDICQ